MLSLFTLIFVFYNCILKPFITFRIRNSDLTRSRCLGLQNDKNPFTQTSKHKIKNCDAVKPVYNYNIHGQDRFSTT